MKMPRKKLTEKEKAAMQQARQTVAKDKDAARKLLAANKQFANPKFWSTVEPKTAKAVEKAIAGSRKAAKKAEISKLERKLANLKKGL